MAGAVAGTVAEAMAVAESGNLSLIEKTNLTLKTAGLNASVISIDQLRFAAPVIFVKIYEIFFGYQLERINYSPSNRYDHAMNVDIVLHALQSRYDSPLLHQTTGNLVVSGDIRSIEIIMSIFYGLAQKIVNEREESLKNTAPPVVLEPKPPKSKTRAFYRSNTTQETTAVTGEFKVIMDRVRTLESKVHSNIFNTEDEVDNQDFDNKSENATRKGSIEKSGRRSRPTSAPPGGRKKKVNQIESETHLFLSGGMDERQGNHTGEGKQKKIKKTRKKKAADENETPSTPIPAPEVEREFYDRFKSKSQSLPSSRPSSAGHRRPKAPSPSDRSRHDFVRRSASSASQHNTSINGLYSYDLRTGHRISKMDSEELLEQQKQRLLSLGVIMTDDGELRALNSNVPITIHDIRVAREKQKQHVENVDHSKPFTPTIGKYPSRKTEQSVEDYQKRMTQLKNPEPPIHNPSTTRNLSTYRHLEKYDMVLSIEHCHDCENHPMTLRHNSAEYISHADEILRYAAQFIHSLHPCIRLGVMRFPAKLKSKKESGGRVGALEVQIGYRNQNSEVISDLIYSKLNTRRWPSKSVIEKRLASITSHFGLQCYPDPGDTTYEGMSGEVPFTYPVGRGPWSEVPLSDASWKYTLPISEDSKPKEEDSTSKVRQSTLVERKASPIIYKADTTNATPQPLPVSEDSKPKEEGEVQQCTHVEQKASPLIDKASVFATNANPLPLTEEPKLKKPNAHVRWCFDSRAYAFFPKFSAGDKVKVQHCPNPYGGIELYSFTGIVQTVHQDSTTLENIVKVQLKYVFPEVSINEDFCIRETEVDQLAPPNTFQTTNDDIPLVLSQIITYGIANDLVNWKIQNSKDSKISSVVSPGTHLKLSRASFSSQIHELVWRGIKASPGTKPGFMILPNQSEDIDVQLAYSPAVLEHIFKKYGEAVNMTLLMKTIQPSISDSQIQQCYDSKSFSNPSEKQSHPVTESILNESLVHEAAKTSVMPSLTQVSNESQPPIAQAEEKSSIVPDTLLMTSTSTPDAVVASTPISSPIIKNIEETTQSQNDTETVVIDDNTQFSLSFMLIEFSYANRVEGKNKSLTLNLNYQHEVQTCSISGLEGQAGKRHITDLDWNPIQFQKSDLESNGHVSITLSHRNDAIGAKQIPLKTFLSSPLNETQKVLVEILIQDGVRFTIGFDCILRAKKFENLSPTSPSLFRLDTHNFPEEMDLYPDDYETLNPPELVDRASESHHPYIQIEEDRAYAVRLEQIRVTKLTNVELFGSNDPFCLLSFGSIWIFKTTAQDNAGESALWDLSSNLNETSFLIDGKSLAMTPLSVEIYDENNLGSNTLIGRANVNMKTLFENLSSNSREYSFDIVAEDKNRVSGTVILKFIIETNDKIQAILDHNEHISVTFDSLKWQASETTNLPKRSFYAVLNLDYWEKLTSNIMQVSGICDWEKIGISEIFPGKLLMHHLFKIDILMKQKNSTPLHEPHDDSNTLEAPDKLYSRATFNLTQLLISEHLQNHFHIDTFNSITGKRNGRLYLTIQVHSPHVMDNNPQLMPTAPSITSPRDIMANSLNLADAVLEGDSFINQDELEKSLLLDIFKLTGGQNHWLDTSLWNSETRLSDWLNIDLDQKKNLSNETETVVTGLRLGSNGLTGAIPPQICQLKYLTELHLFDNALHGAIPSEIGDLTFLRILYLNGNELSGPIPSTIGNCINLEEIDFERNLLSGPIPEELALPKLIILNISRNKFDSNVPIPEKFLECKYLTSFCCDMMPFQYRESPESSFHKIYDWISAHQVENIAPKNEVSERMASDLTETISSLRRFSEDMLTVGTPFESWEVSSPPSKKQHSMQGLQLDTFLSWEGIKLNNFGQLISLILPETELCGEIPPSIGNFQQILYLDLSNNSLEGTLPSQLFKLRTLQYLYLNDNSLEGELEFESYNGDDDEGYDEEEEGLTNLRELRTLCLSNNQFTGTLSAVNLSKLIHLQKLNLSQNKFQGKLTESLFQFSSLKELNLSENNLTGPIPSLSGVPLLRILNLSKNQLDGPIPDSISELVHLRTFDISFTDVTGSLPEGMTHLKVLEEIDLQMTKLEIADQQGELFLFNELIRRISLQHFVYLPHTHFPPPPPLRSFSSKGKTL